MTRTKVRAIRRVSKRLPNKLKAKLFFTALSIGVFVGLTALMQPDLLKKVSWPKSEPKAEVASIHMDVTKAESIQPIHFTEPVITIKVEESEAERKERILREEQSKKIRTPRREVIARSVPQRIESDGGDAQAIGRRRVAEVWGEDQWPAFQAIIQRESGWVVGNRNRSSGACGLGQALPCSKLGSAYGSAEGEVNWVIGYIAARYQTPQRALAFQQARGWY